LSTVFNLVLHVLLLGSLLFFVVALIGTAFSATSKAERALRVMALFAGAMISVGASASGVDYATFTVNALSQAKAGSAGAHVVTTVVPALLGVGLGFALVGAIRRNTEKAWRILCLIGMLATTAFLRVYADAATQNGFELGTTALPNMSFSAGVILTVLLTFKTEQPGAQAQREGIARSLLSTWLGRRASAPSNAATTRQNPADPYGDL